MPSKLEQLQLQFRQKLMQEKEERMIKIHTDSQQKALNKVTKFDATHPLPNSNPVVIKQTTNGVNSIHHSPVKKGSPGVDRSRPLPPIPREQKYNYVSRSTVSGTVNEKPKSSVSQGARSKSVDTEARQNPIKTNSSVRTKQRTDNGFSVDNEAKQPSYSHYSREKSVEDDYISRLKQTELHRLKMNAKVKENVAEKTNGHFTYNQTKSSTEQHHVFPTNGKSRGPTSTDRPKPKAQASSSVLKKPSTNGVSKSINTSRAAPARKPPNPNQEQCRYCGRNFNKDRIEKHRTICAKASQKKVKVFDVTKMRVQGTEAEQYVKKGAVAVEPPKPKKSNWKKQHEEFIDTIRQAKVMQRHLAAGGKVSDLPPPPPSDTSHYVPCPYCGRKFNEGVAERHIPKCKNIVSNKKTFRKK